jgi:hypothetical protein
MLLHDLRTDGDPSGTVAIVERGDYRVISAAANAVSNDTRLLTIMARQPRRIRLTATGEAPMKLFNALMRVVSSLLGLIMVMSGIVWMLQGLNLAFRVGFMVGDYHWTIYGALTAIVGIAQVVWSNTRQTRG